MSTNEIDACYLAQAQNLLKKSNAGPDGIKVEQAASVFSAINLDTKYKDSKSIYLKKIDTDNNGYISTEELASVFQRADKSALSETLVYEKNDRNNQITDSIEINYDFAKNGAIPYLLSEAKDKDPEKYEQIKERLETGAFTITDEQDENFHKQKLDNSEFAHAINSTLRRYEGLKTDTESNPQATKIFLDKLADGQVASYQIDSSHKKITFREDSIDDKNTIFATKETYKLNNPQKPITTKTTKVSKIDFDESKVETLDNDPFIKNGFGQIKDDVLSEEQLKYYDEHILKAIDDPQKFSELMDNLGSNLRKSLDIHTPLTITDKPDALMGFNNQENKIIIAYDKLKVEKERFEKTGTPPDKMKQELVKSLLASTSHEYWHAKQFALTNNPPPDATPEEKTVINKYRKNFKEYYLDPLTGIALDGSARKYSEQPIEKSAFALEDDVSNHIQIWYAKQGSSTP